MNQKMKIFLIKFTRFLVTILKTKTIKTYAIKLSLEQTYLNNNYVEQNLKFWYQNFLLKILEEKEK